ncbi:MAG: hypothetical protein ACC612_12485 [Methanomethylovorans sp.]
MYGKEAGGLQVVVGRRYAVSVLKVVGVVELILNFRVHSIF